MITLSTIKAEAVKRFDSACHKACEDGNTEMSGRTYVAIEKATLSEIDRVVGVVAEEMEEWAEKNKVLGSMGSYRTHISFHDLLQKLSTLTKDSKGVNKK